MGDVASCNPQRKSAKSKDRAEKREKHGNCGIARPKLAYAYRRAMGCSDVGTVPISRATPADLLAHVIEWTHPVDALGAVHDDGMALVRALAAGADDEQRDTVAALWRVFDRLEVVTEIVNRADWEMVGQPHPPPGC